MQMLACGELQCKHWQSMEGLLTGRAVGTIKLLFLSFLIGVEEIPELRIPWKGVCTVKLLFLSFLIGVEEIPELRIPWKGDLYC
jgi:hypothetical protein